MVSATRTVWRDKLAERLFPAATSSSTAVELAILLCVGICIAFFRLGYASLHGVLWAEDGTVFLQQAYDKGAISSLMRPYAGYLLATPRAITALAVQLPVAWQGLAICLAAAAVQACVAVVAFVSTAPHITARWPRLLIFLAVVAVPVGPEVIDSLANIQWFLIYGASLGVLWRPASRVGSTLMGLLVFATAVGTAFAFIPAGLAVLRAIVLRSRSSVYLATAASAGFAIQAIVVATAPPRASGRTLHPKIQPHQYATTYLTRVIGDGVLGVARHAPGTKSTGLLPAVFVLLLLGLLVATVVARRRSEWLFLPAILLALSLATFAPPVLLNRFEVADPFSGGRYYVTPVLFVLTATAMLLGRSLAEPIGRQTAQWAGAISAVAVGACVLYGLTTSWRARVSYGREVAPSWSSQIAAAERHCRTLPLATPVRLRITPASSAVVLSCTTILNH